MYNDYTYRVEKELAMMLASVSHHLHPEIVSYIKNKNLEFKSEFESYSHPKLNIEDFLFDGSDCLFPGLRRPVNKEKTTKKWKNNINEIDGTIFNDNTYPRHVWSFLTLNKSYSSTTWKESGLNAFELAHIFGHKIDETDLEKRVFDKFNINRNPYSLFTSASNVVLIPKGLTKPTDKLESIKLCYYRRHIELYGENFYNMSGFKNEMVPEWYNEIIWLDPILPKEWKLKIENLLDYRSKHLELKYQGFDSVRLSNKEVVSKKINSTADLKIGKFVQKSFKKLFDEGKLTNNEILNLQKPDYCKRVFNAGYEVLRKSSRSKLDHLGRPRYYAKEITPNYWLSSQWYEHQRELFLKWMKSI